MPRQYLVLLGSILSACGSSDGPQTPDAAAPIDTGVVDVVPDAGGMDAGEADSGPVDQGGTDAGVALTVASVSPAFGGTTGGESILVEVLGVGASAELRIDGELATDVRVVAGGAAVQATLPALTAGTKSVEVRSEGQTATLADAFLAGAFAPAAGLRAGAPRDLALDPNGDGLWMATRYGLYLRPTGSDLWLDRSWTLPNFELRDFAHAPSAPTNRFVTSGLDLLRSTDGLRWARVGLDAARSEFRDLLVTSANADVQYATFVSTRGTGPNELPVAYTDTSWRFLSRCMTNGVDVRPVPVVDAAFLDPSDDRLVLLLGGRLYKARDPFCLSFSAIDAGLVGGTRSVSLVPNGRRLFAVIPSGVFTADEPGALWDPRGRPDPALLGLVAGSDMQLYGWTAADGALSVSSDGGRTWTVPAGGPRGVDAIFVPDGAAPTTAYARSGQAVLLTEDGGETWRVPSAPAVLDVVALDLDPSAPMRVWAASAAGLHRSEDAGATWTDVVRDGPRRSVVVTSDGLRALRSDGTVEASSDGGTTFRPIGQVPGALQMLRSPAGTLHVLSEGWIWREGPVGLTRTSTLPRGTRPVALTLGASDQDVLLATETGALRSRDGGATFLPRDSVTRDIRLTALGRSVTEPNAVYASGLDSATFAPRFLASFDGGATWQRLPDVSPNPASNIVVGGIRGERVWFASGFALFGSSDSGMTSTRLNPSTTESPRAAAVRVGVVRDLVFGPSDRLVIASDGYGVVYAEGGGL